MKRIAKARNTEECKVPALQLIAARRRPADVAREIGVVEQNLHNWHKAHREGRLGHGQVVEVSPEQMKIARLRAEVGRLKMESEFLKRQPRTLRRSRFRVSVY
jgi:transposase